MLQLRRLRTFTKSDNTEQEYDTNFEPEIMVESHSELFKNLDTYIAKIPEFERWNCHYTLGGSDGGKKRGKGNFKDQNIIPFDIDGIEFGEDRDTNKRNLDAFRRIFFEVTGFHEGRTAVVFSGGGLHFLVEVESWNNKDYFKKHSKQYAQLCTNLEEAFKKENLKFKEMDRAVWAPNHMLRLPGTLNKKPGKKDRMCILLQPVLEKQEAPWSRITVPKSSKSSSSKSVPTLAIDSSKVQEDCLFLRHCAENQGEVNESQWYAALSIWGRLDKGRELAHENSKAHPKYNPEQCDAKLNQALGPESGPRTCDNIGSLWGGCSGCKHFGRVKSPIQIRSQDFIATRDCGFMLIGEKGNLKPQYDDLVKFFEEKHPYVTNSVSGEVYIFDGKKYQYISKNEIRGFAGEHFNPQPNETALQEFLSRINRRKHVKPSFLEVGDAFINFNNGILDIKTGKLLPHDPGLGFLYVLPYDYQEGAKCPEFDAMMKRVTCGDKELEELLLEYVGYSLCDRTYKHHKALILIGEGSNGKSTFLDIVKALAGAENFSALGIKEMDKDTNRALLEGKLVNISDEMPNMGMQDTDIFKKMMGGSITIRRLYGMPTVHRCTTKLMFAANEIPATYDNSHGMFRRLLIVPFDARFEEGKVDHGLMDRLLGELPGIFNRVLDAFKRLRERGAFRTADRSTEQLNAYRAENDEIGDTLKDMLDIKRTWNQEDWVSFHDLFSRLVPIQVTRNGDRDRYTKRFRKALARAVPDLKKRTAKKWVANLNGGGDSKIQAVGYFGIGVKKETEETFTNGKVSDPFELGLGSRLPASEHPISQ